MCTVEVKLYQYDELPTEEAKEKARDWMRQGVFEDSASWEFVYEDAANIAELFGLDIRQRAVKRMNGSTTYAPRIYFTGFSSQGDGACFEGRYTYKKGALKAVKEYAPKDETLHAIVKRLQDAQRKVFYSAYASTKQDGHYYHSGCMSVSIGVDKETSSAVFEEVEQDIKDALRSFADWIYSRLEQEYYYQTSDEAIEENLRGNDYEFTEDGERY